MVLQVYDRNRHMNNPNDEGGFYLKIVEEDNNLEVVVVNYDGVQYMSPYLIRINKETGAYMIHSCINTSFGLDLDERRCLRRMPSSWDV